MSFSKPGTLSGELAEMATLSSTEKFPFRCPFFTAPFAAPLVFPLETPLEIPLVVPLVVPLVGPFLMVMMNGWIVCWESHAGLVGVTNKVRSDALYITCTLAGQGIEFSTDESGSFWIGAVLL